MIYLAYCLSLAIAGYISDQLEKRKVLNKTTSRKIFETIALIGPAITFGIIPSLGKNPLPVVVLLIMSMGFYGFFAGGDNPIVVDMAPDYSGTLYGFTMAFAAVSGFLAPVFVGFLLDFKVNSNLLNHECLIIDISN